MGFSPSIMTLTLNLLFAKVTKDLDFFQHYAIDGYRFVLDTPHRPIAIKLR